MRLVYQTPLTSLFNAVLDEIDSSIHYEDIRRYNDGKTQKTYKNGILHSVNGEPALVEYDTKGNKTKEVYFWEGERTTKDIVQNKIQELEDNKEHVVRLGNKEYRVKGKQLKKIEEQLGLVEIK